MIKKQYMDKHSYSDRGKKIDIDDDYTLINNINNSVNDDRILNENIVTK